MIFNNLCIDVHGLGVPGQRQPCIQIRILNINQHPKVAPDPAAQLPFPPGHFLLDHAAGMDTPGIVRSSRVESPGVRSSPRPPPPGIIFFFCRFCTRLTIIFKVSSK